MLCVINNSLTVSQKCMQLKGSPLNSGGCLHWLIACSGMLFLFVLILCEKFNLVYRLNQYLAQVSS